MSNVSFVRTEMLQEKAPPLTERGIVKWVRENLFSGWINSILTVVSLYIIYSLLTHLMPWFLNSIWSAGSLAECREIRDAVNGGAPSACFSVITERWPQLLFGFYPKDLYWRPILAFALLFVALGPILFDNMPRKFLWFSLAYPFLMFWLVWGGSIWTPLLIVASIAATAFIYLYVEKSFGSLAAVISSVVGFVLIISYVVSAVSGGLDRGIASFRMSDQEKMEAAVFVEKLEAANANLDGVIDASGSGGFLGRLFSTGAEGSTQLIAAANNERDSARANLRTFYADKGMVGIRSVESKQLGGFMISVIIGLSGIAFSLPIGIVLALGRQSDLFALKSICVGFIEFIRGVPLITLLFTASLLLNYFLPPGTNFDIILRVIIMVTLFASAYMAETIRGGLAALPKGQYEAADSLGLDYWKAQRLIIMPQALKISIPGIVNNFIGLFKDTTLVIFIGIFDMLGLTNSIRATTEWNGVYWELFIFVAVVFWVCCFSMSRYSQWLERRLKTDNH